RCGLSLLVLPGVVAAAGARRCTASSCRGPWLYRTIRTGHVPRWLSARQARTGSGRPGPVSRESGYFAGHAEWGCPSVTPVPTGRVVSLHGATRHRLTGVGGGDGRRHRGTVGCRRTILSQGGVALAPSVP